MPLRSLRMCAVGLALLTAPPLLAPTATLVGPVNAARTGEPLVGVTVQIEGTRFGAITNSAGAYRIPNVPPGSYTLATRLIGYARMVQAITVPDTGTVRTNFTLEH